MSVCTASASRQRGSEPPGLADQIQRCCDAVGWLGEVMQRSRNSSRRKPTPNGFRDLRDGLGDYRLGKPPRIPTVMKATGDVTRVLGSISQVEPELLTDARAEHLARFL